MEKYPGYIRKPFYYETDQMGIIHHANYIRWFEEARVDILDHLGLPYHSIEAAGIIVPVLGVSCDYKQMIRYSDEIRIEVNVEKYTGTRLDFSYQIFDTTSGERMTTGASQHCFINSETNRLVSLKKANPAFHQVFEAYREL